MIKRKLLFFFLTVSISFLAGESPKPEESLDPWKNYLRQSSAKDNPVIIQWLLENPDFTSCLEGLETLAWRDDPDFLLLLRHLRLNSANLSALNNEMALAFFLNEAFLHSRNAPGWNFAAVNAEELKNLTIPLSSWKTSWLRSRLLEFLPGQDASWAVGVIREEQVFFLGLLRENRGRLPDDFLLEAKTLANAAAYFSGPLVDSLFLELYLESRDPYFSALLRETGLVKP